MARGRFPAACFAVHLLWTGAFGAGAETTPLDASRDLLQSASRSYDLGQAREALALARGLAGTMPTTTVIELEVRSGLLVAELERIGFERLERSDRKGRSEVGGRIDLTAEAALTRLEQLPESSERWRLRADLLATMIRSDFRAKKFRRAFEEAVERARTLDPENAHVWVTSAKPLIFAGPERGQNLAEAIRYLDRALEIEPGLESALLLRGEAEQRRGAAERAAADWHSALEANPRCEPAQRGLERFAGGSAN